ncbi:MAG: histidine phosphotransferase family protein [Alphaproteobacteria bacterium]|jgi:histidine phosphotransferase ChpT
MTEKPDLAALLGSRICHDLISPIGAISNGLELLMMDRSQGGPEMLLISESVANASARIRFFRVAYGLAGPEQRIGRSEVQSILSDLTRGSRMKVDWQSETDLIRREVKIAFLLFQCLESAMAYGGKVQVQMTDQRWAITGAANQLRIEPDLWGILVDPNAQVAVVPGEVQFPLVAAELERSQLRLTTELTKTAIRLSF